MVSPFCGIKLSSDFEASGLVSDALMLASTGFVKTALLLACLNGTWVGGGLFTLLIDEYVRVITCALLTYFILVILEAGRTCTSW